MTRAGRHDAGHRVAGARRRGRLAPAVDSARRRIGSSRCPTGEVLACIWHLSDVHLCDSESPARLEYLDRYSDPDSPYREELGDIGTYRPQEALTVQVAVAMVETVNAILVGPTTGAPIDTVLLTGDVTDNAQRNELSWYQTILEGGVVSPRSGGDERSSWVGATDAQTWDERYWHPDGPPPGVEPDLPTRVFGYPTIPGLVAAARRDVSSPGLALPWLTVYGNHDGLVQGTVAPDDALRALAVGDCPNHRPADWAWLRWRPAMRSPRSARRATCTTTRRHAARITPDAARDFVGPGEFAHATRPAAAGDPDEPTYYVADVGRLRIICLDTVNPHGGWQGSIGETQFAWLVDQLDEAADRYVVIASHHPSPTLTNDHRPDGAERRVLGAEILATLLGAPERHRVDRRPRALPRGAVARRRRPAASGS